MVVRHDPRQVSVRCGQFEGDAVAVVDNVFHAVEQRLGRGLAVFTAVVVHGGHNVCARHLPTGVERGVRVQLESPLGRIRRCRPFGRDITTERLVGVDHGQVGAVRVRQRDGSEGQVCARIVRVGRVTVVLRNAESPARLRRRLGRGGPQARGRRGSHTGRHGIVHERTA